MEECRRGGLLFLSSALGGDKPVQLFDQFFAFRFVLQAMHELLKLIGGNRRWVGRLSPRRQSSEEAQSPDKQASNRSNAGSPLSPPRRGEEHARDGYSPRLP